MKVGNAGSLYVFELFHDALSLKCCFPSGVSDCSSRCASPKAARIGAVSPSLCKQATHFSFIGTWLTDFLFAPDALQCSPTANSTGQDIFTAIVPDLLSSRWTLGFLTGILIRQTLEWLGSSPPCLLNALNCFPLSLSFCAAFCMLPSSYSPIFSSPMSSLFIDFLALFYFNDHIILFYWNPFFGLYSWEPGTQDSLWNLDKIMPSYQNSNSREENPRVSLWDAREGKPHYLGKPTI